MKRLIAICIIFVFAFNNITAQEAPLSKEMMTDTIKLDPYKYKTRLLRSTMPPLLLIGYGITTMNNHGLYSDYQARNDIRRIFGTYRSHVDDYLQYAPYAEFAALLLLKVKCKNDVLNTALLILKSELLVNSLVFPIKYLTHRERPYSYQNGLDGVPLSERENNQNNFHSLPSGHTAQAFVAATIVFREFRYINRWYGIAAYTVATAVAAFRMINDQHWQSDVIIGAGIGILGTNFVYSTHLHKWGRKDVCLVPMYNGQIKGMMVAYTF